jgi:hypothetical protein
MINKTITHFFNRNGLISLFVSFTLQISLLVKSSAAGAPKPPKLDSSPKIFLDGKTYRLGNCTILNLDGLDLKRSDIENERYGIRYKDHLINKTYYPTLETALVALEQVEFCTKSDHIGDCSILYPEKADLNHHFCESNLYTVTYNGIILDDVCYDTLEQAMQMLSLSRICRMGIKYDLDQFFKSINTSFNQ